MPDLSRHRMGRERGRPLLRLLLMMQLKLGRVSVGILMSLILLLLLMLLLRLMVVVVVVTPLLWRGRLLRRARILHVVKVGVVLALQHQELLPVLLGVDSMVSRYLQLFRHKLQIADPFGLWIGYT